MFFTLDTWRVTAPMPALHDASSVWSQMIVTDDDLESFCRVLRQNGVDNYSISRNRIGEQLADLANEEDCGCGDKLVGLTD